jgi:hypothetical protein
VCAGHLNVRYMSKALPFSTRYRPGKRWIASLFILLYLIPLTLLFCYSLARSNAGGVAILTLLFALPIYSLWIAVLDYSWFQKGEAPFEPGIKSKLVLMGLGQGMVSVMLCFAVDPILDIHEGFQTFTGAVFTIFGYVGLPAAIFAGGVLIKAYKEKHSAPRHSISNSSLDTDASRQSA